MFEEVRLRLDRAQATYVHALKQIDAAMKPILGAHPEGLEEAQAIQAQYGQIDYTPLALKAPAQPEDSPAA